ncbi:MAG: 4-alpha-glucanotransferase [Actinomycetota bacterium]
MKELAEKAQSCGIALGYHDVGGTYRHSPAATIRQLIEVLERQDALERTPLTLRPGEELPFQGGIIHLETGETVDANTHLPGNFPIGYHSLLAGGQRVPRRLVVSPGSCHLPAGLRTWGWAAQLYSVRSEASWGVGDLNDLCDLGAWSSEKGAGMILINPLGAPTPGRPVPASPYSPSSRCFRNPIYLGIDHLAAADPLLADLAVQGRSLNHLELIDRDLVAGVKSQALEHLYGAFANDYRFDEYCRRQGTALDDFATFCALSEERLGRWTGWPEAIQRPDAWGITSFKQSRAPRIRYHKWVQWLIEQQLAVAGANIGLIQDLPVGVDPAGADTWMFPGAFARGFTVGAPPDAFNPNGQNWGIAPLHPGSLAGSGLDCLVRMLNSGFAHSAALRIDHVMGFSRLFWIPEGGEPADGAYVRYPFQLLLDVLAIESVRAGSFVIGEDLGTVEPEVRAELARRSVLSCRILLFEPEIAQIPELAMAAVTTHDLPTVAGLWSGSDLNAQRRLGMNPSEPETLGITEALRSAAGISGDAPVGTVAQSAHLALARSRAAVVLATLEDAIGVEKRPNMPGTVDEWPNWRQPLPVKLEDLEKNRAVLDLARAMSELRPSNPSLEQAPPGNG